MCWTPKIDRQWLQPRSRFCSDNRARIDVCVLSGQLSSPPPLPRRCWWWIHPQPPPRRPSFLLLRLSEHTLCHVHTDCELLGIHFSRSQCDAEFKCFRFPGPPSTPHWISCRAVRFYHRPRSFTRRLRPRPPGTKTKETKARLANRRSHRPSPGGPTPAPDHPASERGWRRAFVRCWCAGSFHPLRRILRAA
jgi:hypothetical protein